MFIRAEDETEAGRAEIVAPAPLAARLEHALVKRARRACILDRHGERANAGGPVIMETLKRDSLSRGVVSRIRNGTAPAEGGSATASIHFNL